MNRLHTGLGVAGGIAVIALLLGLPTPRHSAAPVPAAVAGPATLATVWPAAKPFPIPAGFPDGSAYTPVVILDPTASVGVLARSDGAHTDLVLAPAAGPPRVLQSQLATDGGSYDGITVTADRIYWMHTLSDSDGHAHVTLWAAARSGGPATPLTADTGTPVFYGSQYDLQVVGDRIYWASAHPGTTELTDLRSVASTGGQVSVRVLDGAWALSAWPWLVTAPSASDAPTRLRNLLTGANITAAVPANKMATCSPTWCRLIPDNASVTTTELVRPDGSDQRVIGDADTAAIDSDVALLERFELLMTTKDSAAQLVVSKLALYDIQTRRTIVLDPAATGGGARGTFIWWSTGDNETLTWHGIDLRTLS
jgi:hypothetical protein